MLRCFLCEAVGIKTAADAPAAVQVPRRTLHLCTQCYGAHFKAIQLHRRTMYDRLFPGGDGSVIGRADIRPRRKRVMPDRVQ